MTDEETSRPARIAGWGLLLIALPIALFAAGRPPNEHEAVFGTNALDCDGPFKIYMFAVPGLLIYGAGALLNGRHYRRPMSMIVALVCLLVCGAILLNVARAVAEDAEQREACLAR